MARLFHICHAFAYVMLIISFESCRPGVPRRFIQPHEMENILYEYSLANGIVRMNRSDDSLELRVLRASLLKKYDVSEEKFESSLEYYTRHTEQMSKIYDHLADRFEKEAKAQGMSSGEIYSSVNGNSGDTVSIWKEERTAFLTQYKPFNMLSFDVVADTSYHKGDNIIFEFTASQIGKDNISDGVALLAVVFNNDSVASQVKHFSMSTTHMQIEDKEKVGIKSVRGFLMSDKRDNINKVISDKGPSIMFVYNIKMVKMSTKNMDDSHNDSISKRKLLNMDSVHATNGNIDQRVRIASNPRGDRAANRLVK